MKENLLNLLGSALLSDLLINNQRVVECEGSSYIVMMNNIIILGSQLSLSLSVSSRSVPLFKQVLISLSTLYAVKKPVYFTQLDSSEGASLTVNKTG